MRLAQAARKLSITTEDIVSFLAKKDITVIKDSNTKLEDSSVELLYNYYGRPDEEETQQPLPATKVEENIEAVEGQLEEQLDPVPEKGNYTSEPIENSELPIAAEKPLEVTEAPHLTEDTPTSSGTEESPDVPPASTPKGPKYKTVTDLLEEQALDTDVSIDESSEEVIIKAPKVNLKGLNVLGKIELPEKPEKKAIVGEEKILTERKKSLADRAKTSKRKLQNKKRPDLNPQEIRAREKRKAEKKRKAELAARKEQREAYYAENILKPKQQLQKKQQAKKKVAKSTFQKEENPVQTAPKTVLGKFWRWLNT